MSKELFEQHDNLIKYIANKILEPQEKHYFNDLYQEGIVFMLELHPKFKQEGPAKFSTYLYKALTRELTHKLIEYKTGMTWNEYREKRRKERMKTDPEFAEYERARRLAYYHRKKNNPEFMEKKRETQRRYAERKKLKADRMPALN